MDINLYLEDFDNSDLQGHDWWEVMRDAVDQYNQDYSENYRSTAAINGYIAWRRRKNTPDM